MLTTTTRDRPPSAARRQTRPVPTSTPITALTTTSAPSVTVNAAIVSPWKPASPGVSSRLIFRPSQSAWQSEVDSVIWRLCSSSSQSVTVVPDSTVPSRLTAPDWNSIASVSDVFPVPRWPTTATLRIFPGSDTAIERVTSWGTDCRASLTPAGVPSGQSLRARLSMNRRCAVTLPPGLASIRRRIRPNRRSRVSWSRAMFGE